MAQHYVPSRLTKPHVRHPAEGDVRLAHVLAGLSVALDMADGQPAGHAARSALIGLRLAQVMGMTDSEQSALLLTFFVKDLGASANAAQVTRLFGADDHHTKAALRAIDWGRAIETIRFAAAHRRPNAAWPGRGLRRLAAMKKGPAAVRELARARADRGSALARDLVLPDDTIHAIRAIDEHWNGRGGPLGLAGHAIHPFARIVTLAQTMEVFWSAGGARAALEIADARRAQWFEPALVDALACLRKDDEFWAALAGPDVMERALALEPAFRASKVTDEGMDLVAETFAAVIDAKSPWTAAHSTGVADLAVRTGRRLGMSGAELTDLRRAALLHDIGKLGVSSLVLDKPGPLTPDERVAVERHTHDTEVILTGVEGFSHLASLAAAHHERLDGRGYHRGLSGDAISRAARILAVADIADALRASRPYRPGLPPERVLAVIGREAGSAVDPDCYAALSDVLRAVPTERPAQVPAVQVVPALIEDYTQAA